MHFFHEYRRMNIMYYNNCYPLPPAAINMVYAAEGITTLLTSKQTMTIVILLLVNYTVNHKKRDILFLTMTLANPNRFL